MENFNGSPGNLQIISGMKTPPVTNMQVDDQNLSFRSAATSNADDDEEEETSIPKENLLDQFALLSPNLQYGGNEDDSPSDRLHDEDIDDDDGLPLKGTVLFVDVRAENENRSKAISREVEKLGSIVVRRINGMVTHVVFKGGRNSTLCQLKKYPHIHFVSVLWVDACKTSLRKVDESPYVLKFSDTGYCPYPAKARRVKSLQPKTLEEDVNNSGKKAERRRKRLRCRGKTTGDTPPDNIICFDSGDEYIKSSDLYKLVATPRVVPDTPWMINYMNSSDNDRTPGSESITELNSADGSFCAPEGDDTSFTNVIEPSQKKCSSLYGTLPRRLSRDLEECNGGIPGSNQCNQLNKVHENDTNDTSFTNVIEPSQKKCSSLYGTLPRRLSRDSEKSNGRSLDSNRCNQLNKTHEDDINNYPMTNNNDRQDKSSGELCKKNNGINDHLILNNVETLEGKSVLNTVSVNVTNLLPTGKKKKKKKKLLSQSDLLPFEDSPFEDVDEGRQLPPQYHKCFRKGDILNADMVLNNVETSKTFRDNRLLKLKKQRKYLLQPFPSESNGSPDCSFKTAEQLQLRPPNRNKENCINKNVIEGIECRNLINDMSDLQVNSDTSFNGDDDDEKENIGEARSSTLEVNNRRSSGIDFKVGRHFKTISVGNRNKFKNIKTLSSVKDDSCSDSPSSMSSSSEESDDDTESIDSNVSFIHDAKQGLIIYSQNEVIDARKDSNCDSGISDGGTADDNDNVSVKRKTSVRKTKSLSKGGGKSPKASSRVRCKTFSPYNTCKAKSSLVATSLHFSEQAFMKAMLKKLGGFVHRTNVANDTTHVIAGSDRRTLNVLYAMVHGCWILSPKWIADSAERGKWLSEGVYEMQKEFPIAKQARVSRVRNGKSFLQTLFISTPLIYISDVSSPPSDELVKLVTLCGGHVTNSVRKAGLGVGLIKSRRKDLCTVSEKWVLDCISGGTLISTKDYENFVMRNVEGSPGF